MALAVVGAKTGVANLVDLINYTNPTQVQISPNQVEFSALAVYDNSLGYKPIGTNTEVVVKAIDGQGFINGVNPNGFSLWYRRVGLNTGVTSFTDTASLAVDTTWDQLKTAISNANNIVYGDFNIFEQGVALGTDAIYATLPPADGGEGSTQAFNLIPVGNVVESAWVSSSFVYDTTSAVVTGTWAPTDTPLSDTIVIRNLDGFVPAS